MPKRIPILSSLFHPLFIPTYGMLLLNAASSQQVPLPKAYQWVSVLGTFLLTAAFSGGYILILRMTGRISSIYLTRPEERTAPYIVTLIGLGLWCYFLRAILHVPTFAFVAALSGIGVLVVVAVINLKWKISAHLTGWGALTGSVIGYALQMHVYPFWMLATLLILALLLMYERIYLQAHDGKQVVAGFLLGLIFTALPCYLFFL